MSEDAPSPAKRRRAKGGGGAGAAAGALFSAASGPTDDPLMQPQPQPSRAEPPEPGGADADDELPAVMVSIFKSAKLSDIRAANRANGLPSEPSAQSSYLRPSMNFSIVPRAPSMMSRVFEMIAAVLGRSGGREAANSIGFTVVMLNGAPQLAIDVGDERFTFVVSVRITADIYLHPDWHSGSEAAQFPVLGVRCRSMVEKLSQARDFHRVLLYQTGGNEDQLDVVIDTPDRAGNVQHETIKIQSDEWESLELRDIKHRFTMQVAIKMLLQLCRIQREAQGHMTISIHSPDAPPPPPTPVPDAAELESGTAEIEASQQPPSRPQAPVRERQNYILRLAVQNAEGEESSMLRPIVNDIERRVDPVTGETITTLHYCEEQPNVGIDLISKLPHYHTLYKQSFSAGYVDAFLSKFDPNKMITIRLADDTPMVMSYLHGGLVVCQMVISPIYEAE